MVNHINVAGLSAATLTFGSTNNNATYNPEHLLLYYSYDGHIWTSTSYTREPATTGNWGLCTATITSIPDNSYLFLKWSATTASVCRIDDMILLGSATPTPAVLPVVGTGTAQGFSSSSATINANTYIAGTGSISEVGVEYKLTGTGAYSPQTTTVETPFTVDLTGLSPSTSYTYRAYAKVGSVISYGKERTFYTQSDFTLSISPTSFTLPSSASSGTFEINSNTAWTVTVAPAATWCTVSTESGNDNATITVNTIANDGVERTATITVSGTGVPNRTVTVVQEAGSTSATAFSVAWNFSGITGTAAEDWPAHQAPQPPSSNTATSLAATDLIATSFTYTGAPAGATWGGSGFNANTDRLDPVRYATTTLTSSTTIIAITEINGNIRRSATGASRVSIQYKIDSGTFVEAWTNTTDFPGTAAAGNSFTTLDLTGITDLQNIPIGTVVTIRIVPYKGAETAVGNWYLNSGNTSSPTALQIKGTEQ
jgi:VCBS repeat-containing protein